MDIYKIERLVLAVDVVVFGIKKGVLILLVRKRTTDPFKDAPALPGVAVRIDETLEAAARRALRERAYLKDGIFLDQLGTFDGLYRDPRGRTVSVAYMGLCGKEKTDENMAWLEVSSLSKGDLPFDHDMIVETATARLRGKLRYTNIAKGFLEDSFRIEELKGVYEAVLGCKINKTNFRNKLLKIRMIEQVRVLNEAVGKKGGRPPHLYRFTQDTLESANRDFL
ncbi:NUDIX domain-containing protein [Desulfococcaceae bacterium HSG8]|nr:NUDIX domain-containing protein [Desulfococcaceae bacterium HSG8]